ncbi:MAG TPA: DUF3572 family protein [Rhizomicrobium sp.]|nr:DUF3572 family protein [Rhizomicrobium sp.]
MTPDTAEALALKALEFLANSPDPLDSFMAASGINAGDLRDRLEEPAVLAEVVDFMLKNEPLLAEFCENSSARARDLHLAHHVLTNL